MTNQKKMTMSIQERSNAEIAEKLWGIETVEQIATHSPATALLIRQYREWAAEARETRPASPLAERRTGAQYAPVLNSTMDGGAA